MAWRHHLAALTTWHQQRRIAGSSARISARRGGTGNVARDGARPRRSNMITIKKTRKRAYQQWPEQLASWFNLMRQQLPDGLQRWPDRARKQHGGRRAYRASGHGALS